MKIQALFDRDIHRNINPAVTAGDTSKATVSAEIEEYVFTDNLISDFFIMLESVLNKKKGKTGIWINGYYGSGKSHFIKYIHYLLDAETQDLAFQMLAKAVDDYDGMKPGANSDITKANLQLLQKRAAAAACDDILFNAEAESSDGDERERMTRILLSVFNRHRGYNSSNIQLALLLEKRLDQKGVFQDFKAAVQDELASNWEGQASEIAAWSLDKVLSIANRLDPDLDVVSMKAAILDKDFKVSIVDTLIPELKSFVSSKNDPNYRLLFLVDEISQYVGSNKAILLNIQSIIEEVSENCNHQVWIACTAQQSLEEVSSNVDGVGNVNEDFGKILGRFDTRISLQSNDAAYITQRRVLDKNSDGVRQLGEMFDANQDFIENQFKISHELYKGYGSRDEFISAYPFVPYQFKLISDVFSAFQSLEFVIKEVKDNERSVLGITHSTTKDNAHMDVGRFMSFDAFYNGQFSQNLTQKGSKAIENALSIEYVRGHEFAQRVVKVLFMISNLTDSQRQTFPSTIENMTVLLMEEVDQNRKKLQDQIRTVLEKLQEGSILREENGSYFFFNEDEMEVQALINNQTVGMHDRFETFWKQFFTKLTNIRSKPRFGENDFPMSQSLEDMVLIPANKTKFAVKVLLTDDRNADELSLNYPKNELVICINEWFNQDDALKSNFNWYCKTNKYFINNSGGATGRRNKTNENFQVRNQQLETEIMQALKMRFKETRFISQQQVLEASDISGPTPKDRLEYAIEKHLSAIFSKHEQCKQYAQNQQGLKESAASRQTFMSNELEPAEALVNQFISANNDEVLVQDVISKFEGEPFGWKEYATLDVLIHLVKKKHREFRYNNNPRHDVVDFINKALKSGERSSCEVVGAQIIPQALLDGALAAYRNIFNEELPHTTDMDALFDGVVAALKQHLLGYKDLQERYYGERPWGTVFHKAVDRLRTWSEVRDPERLFKQLAEGQNEAKELMDLAKGIQGFAESNDRAYVALQGFMDDESGNFAQLNEADQKKAATITEILRLEDPRSQFRVAMTAKEELNAALVELSKDTRSRVAKAYQAIYTDLQKEAENLGVTSDSYTAKAVKMDAIAAEKTIAGLQSLEFNADTFRQSELHKIIAAAAPASDEPGGRSVETITYQPGQLANIISNAQEMEAYLTKLRADLEKHLGENKTIILD
tara:strand:+ start:3019 stop:6546 length:3528 start_codon:yes stop_codon:yes gene_type:complete